MLHAILALEAGQRDSYPPPLRLRRFGDADASVASARLSSVRRRGVYEPAAGRIFSTEAIAVAGCSVGRIIRHTAAPEGGEPAEAGSDRPRIAGSRTRDRAAHPRPRTQADLEDRWGAQPDRPRYLRLLRGDRRADRHSPSRSPADRHPQHRGAGTPRAHGADPPRRLMAEPGRSRWYGQLSGDCSR